MLVAVALLPTVSVVVTLASMVRSASAIKSAPGRLMEKVPLETTPVYVLPSTVRVTVSPS